MRRYKSSTLQKEDIVFITPFAFSGGKFLMGMKKSQTQQNVSAPPHPHHALAGLRHTVSSSDDERRPEQNLRGQLKRQGMVIPIEGSGGWKRHPVPFVLSDASDAR